MPPRSWPAIVAVLLPCAAHAAATEPETATLLSPVASACISSPFGPRVLSNRPLAGTYHYGIDMPAAAGEAVRAVAPGKVTRIQRKGPGGLEVMMQHDGFVAIYSHLGMVTPALAEGKTALAAGEKLGVVGHSGLTYGMHVYFEMLLSGRPVDPAPYLGVKLCNGSMHRTSADSIASDAPRSESACIGMRMPPEQLSYVSRGFGHGHAGIDLMAPYGSPVRAAGGGTVVYAGWYFEYGRIVDIRHADRLITRYAHLSAFAPGIGPGTPVAAGAVIGSVGMTGRAHGPHVHFEVRVDGHPVDPKPYLALASCPQQTTEPLQEARAPDDRHDR